MTNVNIINPYKGVTGNKAGGVVILGSYILQSGTTDTILLSGLDDFILQSGTTDNILLSGTSDKIILSQRRVLRTG